MVFLLSLVFQVEHKKVCGTHVDCFAIRLFCGVWNTPYPAIPKLSAFWDGFAPVGGKIARPVGGVHEEKNYLCLSVAMSASAIAASPSDMPWIPTSGSLTMASVK